MKTATSLLALLALLIIGCRKAEPDSGDTKNVQTPEDVKAAEVVNTPESVVGEKEADLDEPEIRTKILGEAPNQESLQERGPKGEELFYQPNSETPYTGWAKAEYSEGEPTLTHFKAGKQDGPEVSWHSNGQKRNEGNYTDGKQEGLARAWYEDGRRHDESHWADGKITTATTWLPSGERCPTTRIENGTGLWVSYHSNGTKKQEVPFKDGTKEGLWTEWDENGTKRWEGHFKDGKEHGLWTGWHENGKKSSEVHYKDGEPDGRSTEWHENGTKIGEFHFKDGKKHGLMTGWHENGKKAWEDHYKNGERDGRYSQWREDGTKAEVSHFKNGKPHGPVTAWHENGKRAVEATYKDGKAEGPFNQWHENGTKEAEATYKDGEADGPFSQWHENGTKVGEGTYRDGDREGQYTERHENGTKSGDAHYKDWKADGPFTQWHENGTKSEEGTYKDGDLEGQYTAWHKNGTKAEESHFRDGKADGPFILWHDNGKKSYETTFKDGEQDGPYTAWHENGKEAEQGRYKNGKQEGLATRWRETGEKFQEAHFKDGERDGPCTEWHKNGAKAGEGNYKNGKLEGPYTRWHKNGEKMEEGTFGAPPVRAILVRPDSEWRWLHPVDGVDPKESDPDFHTTFFSAKFDDENWKSGKDTEGTTGGFGYGDAWFKGVDIGTPEGKATPRGQAVRYGAYFRHRFKTEKAHPKLELHCQRDDGIIIYLDGKEVARDNMRDGEEAYDLPAVGPQREEQFTHRIPLGDLTLPAGEHVLAISLHNTHGPSSDLRIGGISLVEAEPPSAKVKAPGKKDSPRATPIPNKDGWVEQKRSQEKWVEAQQLERTYLRASRAIEELIEENSYPEALAAARGMAPGFVRAQMLMEVSDSLREEGEIERANALLDEALEQARLESNSGLKATTLASISDEFRESGNKASASKALEEARSALDDIKRFETGAELSAVIAVAESCASAGDLKAAKEVAQLVNAQAGEMLMSRLERAAKGEGPAGGAPPPFPPPPPNINPPEKKEPGKNEYRTAIPIPGQEGFVFNPFTNNPVDVRNVPPGTIVRDPNDPDPTHRFRVP